MKEITTTASAKAPSFKVITTEVFDSADVLNNLKPGQEAEILLPEGLTRSELDAIVKEYGQERFMGRAQDFMQRMNAVQTDTLDDEGMEVIGSSEMMLETFEGIFETRAEALTSLGYKYDENMKGWYEDFSDSNIEVFIDETRKYRSETDLFDELFENEEITYAVTEHFPPMWATVWEMNYLPSIPGVTQWDSSDTEKAQAIAEYANVTIYQDTDNDKNYVGVNGAGYDFYESHWIALAYLCNAFYS